MAHSRRHHCVFDKNVLLSRECEKDAAGGLCIDVAGERSLASTKAAFCSGLLPHQFKSIW